MTAGKSFPYNFAQGFVELNATLPVVDSLITDNRELSFLNLVNMTASHPLKLLCFGVCR